MTITAKVTAHTPLDCGGYWVEEREDLPGFWIYRLTEQGVKDQDRNVSIVFLHADSIVGTIACMTKALLKSGESMDERTLRELDSARRAIEAVQREHTRTGREDNE